MTIHELKQRFLQKRSHAIEDVSQLLDFAKQTYINNEMTVKEFRNIIRELEALGAKNPDPVYQNEKSGN
ncbi:YppF family protein [Siminovitchia sp. 179-K 8D1 HS]|uniref:YppF family protein n=1 Tax=Siminovitchia sp. 179-K 8D1 HS TaxID=3142385 RepID=UPI0039A3E1FA